jgi:hypothetical protein
MNQIKFNDFIPLAHQKMLKLDGLLGANPPALTATSAFGHIVFKNPSVILINKIQCRCRTIFHAGQTTITVLIYYEVRHKI